MARRARTRTAARPSDISGWVSAPFSGTTTRTTTRIAALCALVLTGALVGPAVAQAEPVPTELQYACALTSTGHLRAVDTVMACDTNEDVVTIQPGPILVCVQPSGPPRYVKDLATCRQPARRLTLPPTNDVVHLCAAASSGALRRVTDATGCPAGEIPYRVRPNDAAPSVTATSPTTGATQVGTTTDVSITFSEAVTAEPDAVTMTCAGVTEPSTLRSSPGTTLTLDPDDTLSAGVTCQVTVVAARISDVDTNDPPDSPSSVHTFTFTTDSPPALSSSTPSAGANAVEASANIVLTFSQSVDVTPGALALTCSGSARSFTLTGSGTDVVTLDPDDPLPTTSLCSVTAAAAAITDAEDGDPPDSLSAPIDLAFTTVDDSPAVTETSPADGAEGLGVDTDFAVTFSEPVTIAPDAFELTCGGQTALFRTSGSGTANITLDPIDDLPQGASCLVKVVASAITDIDAVDPPDHPAGDSLVLFSTDSEPAVETTAPLTGDAGVAPGDDIVIRFTEDVSFSAASFDLSCDGAPQPFSVSGTGTDTATIDPTGELPATATCAVTVLAAGVNDADAADPPDTMAADHLFGFTTVDIAPTIESTTPVGGATDVPGSSSVSVTFSEPVTTSAAAFALECPRGASIPFSLSGSPGSVITLDPNGSLPAGAECTVAVTGSGISDADAVDPPDVLADNRTLSFTVGSNAAPMDISLSTTSIAENNAVDATVATLSTTDADATDTFTYSLVGGTGSTDNASFSIVGSSLRAGIAFDHETKSSYAIRIRTTDSAGAVYEEAVTIAVNDVTEGPTGNTLSGTSVP